VIRRRAFGLRPRLLAALVFTSVVTLAVAALALLPPLQQRLTDQAASDLENATRTDAPLFRDAIVGSLKSSKRARLSPEDRLASLSAAIANRADTLRLRTDARVIVASSVPGAAPIFDTDFAGSPLPRSEILGRSRTRWSARCAATTRSSSSSPSTCPTTSRSTRFTFATPTCPATSCS
jgi:hypothetical protein